MFLLENSLTLTQNHDSWGLVDVKLVAPTSHGHNFVNICLILTRKRLTVSLQCPLNEQNAIIHSISHATGCDGNFNTSFLSAFSSSHNPNCVLARVLGTRPVSLLFQGRLIFINVCRPLDIDTVAHLECRPVDCRLVVCHPLCLSPTHLHSIDAHVLTN
jgi:hypothetical protein